MTELVKDHMTEMYMEALRLYDIYDQMPSDRGGKNGPRGKAYAAFVLAKDKALSALPEAPAAGVKIKPCEKYPQRYCNCEGFYPACREAQI